MAYIAFVSSLAESGRAKEATKLLGPSSVLGSKAYRLAFMPWRLRPLLPGVAT